MKRPLLAVTLATAGLAGGGVVANRGCSEKDCTKLAKAVEVACATPSLAACQAAQEAYEENCTVSPSPSPTASPEPTPTPEPSPTSTPPNLCADHPDLCADDSVCVDTPLGPTCEPKPVPTPTPGGNCWADEHQMTVVAGAVETKFPAMKTAMEKVRLYSGSPKEMLGKLSAQLNLDDECAFAGQEAVFVKNALGHWEEYHAVYFNDGVTGAWMDPGRKYIATHRAGDAQTPGGYTCGLPVPPTLQGFNLHCAKRPNGQTRCDATPQVHGCDFPLPGRNYCAEIGLGTMPGRPDVVRCDCPAGNESDPAGRTCREAWIVGGKPLWRGDGNVTADEENPMLAYCSDCSWIEVCHANGTKCERAILEAR